MKRALASAIVATSPLLASSAAAQVHADLGLSAGASQRVLSGASAGGATPGAVAELTTHFALAPMVRLGGYLHGELAPTNDLVAPKRMLAGGARLKFAPPWPSGDVRAYLALGAGYVGAYSPAYTQPLAGKPASVDSAGGGFVEVPLSVGLAWRVRKPWTLFAELGARFGFAFSGSLYGDNGTRGALLSDGTPAGIAQTGADVFCASLSLGVAVDL